MTDRDDDVMFEDEEPRCTNPGGHSFVIEDTDHGEGRSYCEWCGADGDA